MPHASDSDLSISRVVERAGVSSKNVEDSLALLKVRLGNGIVATKRGLESRFSVTIAQSN